MTLIDTAVGMPSLPSGVHNPDSVILTILLAMFVVMGINTPHLRHIVSTFFSDLISRRQRANIFDEHSTAADTRILLLMLIQTSVMEGILLAGWCAGNDSGAYVLNTALLSGIAVAFNTFSYVACATIGYVFTSPQNAGQWRHTLNASQGVLGIGLLIPAAASAIWPGNPVWIYAVGLAMYILVRICYVFKGFSFFYRNTLSSFYFILYLCALEIIPVIAVGHTALMLTVTK